ASAAVKVRYERHYRQAETEMRPAVALLADRDQRVEQPPAHLVRQPRPAVRDREDEIVRRRSEHDVDATARRAEAHGVVDELVEELSDELVRADDRRLSGIAAMSDLALRIYVAIRGAARRNDCG